MDINKPITNETLVKAIEGFEQKQNKETQGIFLAELKNSKLLAPIEIEEDIPLDSSGITLEENINMKFFSITDSQGKTFLPAFTDWAELRKWNDSSNVQTLIMNYERYKSMISNSRDNYSGFVINPMTSNVVFIGSQIIFANIGIAIKTATSSVMIGEPSTIPEGLLGELEEVLPNLNVECAYFLMMTRDTKQSYIIILDTDSSDKEIFSVINDVASQYLSGKQHLKLASLHPTFTKVVERYEPFYQK